MRRVRLRGVLVANATIQCSGGRVVGQSALRESLTLPAASRASVMS